MLSLHHKTTPFASSCRTGSKNILFNLGSFAFSLPKYGVIAQVLRPHAPHAEGLDLAMLFGLLRENRKMNTRIEIFEKGNRRLPLIGECTRVNEQRANPRVRTSNPQVTYW